MPTNLHRRAATSAARFGLALACCFGLGCQKKPPPRLNELQLGEEVSASGRRLMATDYGLHRLDSGGDFPEAVIAVHGYASRGLEWVYALKKLGVKESRVFFYRWDWQQCPAPAAGQLGQAVNSLLAQHPNIERLRILSHSYGGVVAAIMSDDYRGTVPLEVHLIAAPLAGHPKLTSRCGNPAITPPGLQTSSVSWWQWRTQHALDGAFQDLPADPQVVAWPQMKSVLLPATYQGRRLGHNWSISWVADHLIPQALPADPGGG